MCPWRPGCVLRSTPSAETRETRASEHSPGVENEVSQLAIPIVALPPITELRRRRRCRELMRPLRKVARGEAAHLKICRRVAGELTVAGRWPAGGSDVANITHAGRSLDGVLWISSESARIQSIRHADGLGGSLLVFEMEQSLRQAGSQSREQK